MRYTKQEILEIYIRHTDWLQGKGVKRRSSIIVLLKTWICRT